jgi:hypothetical protein
VVVEIANRQKAVAIDRRWLRDVVRRAIAALGARQAEIGLEEHVLQVLQRRLVELLLGEDRGDGAGDRAR